MKINHPIRGHHPAVTSLPTLIQALVGSTVILSALALLPGPALFLAVLAGAVALAVSLAELRRHGGPDVPRLPLAPEH